MTSDIVNVTTEIHCYTEASCNYGGGSNEIIMIMKIALRPTDLSVLPPDNEDVGFIKLIILKMIPRPQTYQCCPATPKVPSLPWKRPSLTTPSPSGPPCWLTFLRRCQI